MSMSAAESKDARVPPEDVVENGNNKTTIVCERCSSIILLPQKGKFQTREFFLPFMKKKPGAEARDGEMLDQFWLVEDMFTFENLGFTNTCDVEGGKVKYLICADCEVGPIGIHNIANKQEYFISVDRVKYDK